MGQVGTGKYLPIDDLGHAPCGRSAPRAPNALQLLLRAFACRQLTPPPLRPRLKKSGGHSVHVQDHHLEMLRLAAQHSRSRLAPTRPREESSLATSFATAYIVF